MKGAVRRALKVVARRETRVPDAALMLSTLPVPVLVLDREDRFRFANQAAEALLGVSASQLSHMALRDLLPADHPLFAMAAQVRTRDVTVSDHDVTLESPRVTPRRVTVQASPLEGEAGSVLLAIQDASTARVLDQQFTIRSAARTVSGMAAVLAHEVKNPLSGIRGAAQLLEQNASEADRELTQLICEEADRIRAMVDRMDMFGDRPIDRRPVNIHQVLERVRRLAETGFARPHRVVELYDPSLPPVWGSRDQLVQALLNLVKNAAEAAPAGGGEIVLSTAYRHGLRLSTGKAGERVHLPLLVTVRDNGPGIPEDIRPHLFDAFVTGGKPGGQGLGLALVAKIVGDHGGLVEVESRPGRTEFRLHLPMAPEEA